MKKYRETLAAVSKQEIEEALKSTDVLAGAEWEFIFNEDDSTQVYESPYTTRNLFNKIAKTKINYNPWMQGKSHTSGKKWKMEQDTSISDEMFGAELISPPLPLPEFLKICPQIFDAIDKTGKVDESCGFHVGLSLTSGMSKVNPLKLGLFIDEDLIYKLFKKEVRSPTPMKEHFKEVLTERIYKYEVLENTDAFKTFESSLNSALISQELKSRNINFNKLNNGYIEFRYTGGKDYQKKWNKIRQLIGMYVFILKVSCDSNYKKEEYHKKIMELFKKEIQLQREVIADAKIWIKTINKILKRWDKKITKAKTRKNYLWLDTNINIRLPNSKKYAPEYKAILKFIDPIEKEYSGFRDAEYWDSDLGARAIAFQIMSLDPKLLEVLQKETTKE